ncbi:MAG: glycosyltransferase family 4 protein [Opitutales bacterium]
MKIIIYWEYFQRYHNARLSALIRLAEKQGHLVLPVSLSEKGHHGHRTERDPFVDSRAIHLAGKQASRPINDPVIVDQFVDLLEKERPDVVSIVGWYGRGTYRILKWAKKNSKKIILLLAGSQHDKRRNPLKEAYKRYFILSKVDAVLCGGKPHVRYASRLGMNKSSIFTGYNAVDNDFWASAGEESRMRSRELADKLGFRPKQFFVTAGRFIPKKNFEALIEQYSYYRAQFCAEPWDLVIVGDGELRPRLEFKITQLGLNNHVHLPGYLSSEELAPYFGLAGAFVLPSSGFEQWGLVVNEAMAAGLPVIVSTVCGCCEDLVVDGETGFSFSPERMDDLALAMEKISGDEAMRDKMASLAAKHIQGYSSDVFATNFLKACKHCK